MKIGIIGAMDEEIVELKNSITNINEIQINNLKFYEGKLCSKNIVLVESGIGKVNAAISTTLLISQFKVEKIIFTGVAGAVNPKIKVTDIVIGTELAYCDADVTAFNYVYGQMPGMPARFAMNQDFLPSLEQAIAKVDLKSHTGLIVSSDSFIHTREQRTHILKHFPDVMASEMEGAAIAQACHAFGVPFIVIRAISDIPERGTSAVDFDTFIVQAGKRSAQMVHQLLQEWEG